MSEGNERNLESVAPEAAENIEQGAQAPEAPAADDRENAPSDAGRKPKRSKKKKRAQRRVLAVLAIVLVALLVVLGVLLGYGLGRIRSGRVPKLTQEEPIAQGDEIPEFDAFTEALTQENQQALDILAGEDGAFDDNTGMLVGEEGFFVDDEPDADFVLPEGEAVVMAEYGDGKVLMSDEVLETYYEELLSYILSGYSEEEVAEAVLDDVLQTMVSQRVLAERAKEMGLYELTDEDRAAIEEAANAYPSDEEMGHDEIVAMLEESWWEQKLFDELTKDVSVDDAKVQAYYEDRIAEQREDFSEYPDDFEFAERYGELIVYNLPGYRAVKVLTLGFENEDAEMAAYDLMIELEVLEPEEAQEHLKEHQKELDSYFAYPEARASEALEQLRAGADMDEMILSIGADEDMLDDKLRSMGYYVSGESMFWPANFVAAAMALENIGDYSEPVRTEDGVCILQYLGEVAEGEVPLEDVREAIEEGALEEARFDAYTLQVEAWLDEANPSYYPERLQ